MSRPTMPTDRPMRPLPRDGSLFRVKLVGGDMAAAYFQESTQAWFCFQPNSGILLISQDQATALIKSWAPMGYGTWSPHWDDLTEQLADVREVLEEKWWIWQKMGHPPRFAWPTESQANAEAKRLARLYPGNSFIVMRSMRKFRVETIETIEITKEEP